MEERSLRVYNSERTFFNKIANGLTKMLIPTKIGINGFLITIKRTNILKAYEEVKKNIDIEDDEKKEMLDKKYEDMYALYLEAIDKYIMDSIYKKVKTDTASDFEKNALSNYYNIIQLKDNDYTEFKYRKQIYLLGLDYDNIESHGKPQAIERYRNFYGSEMETLYKGLLKHYSIKLSDNLTAGDRDTVYNKIFNTLADYVENILPIKMQEDGEKYKEVVEEYNNFDKFTIGKLDQNDVIEKNLILIGISRKLFTHSLPLVVAESCYIKLLKDARNLIVDTKILRKKEKAYSLLINIIEEYNLRVLLTKIYWDKPDQREEYKEFSKKYREVEKLSIINKEEYLRQKQILFLKADLKKVYQNENRYYKIIKFYKDKLVELGAMRKLKNGCISYGYYVKVDKKLKKVVNK